MNILSKEEKELIDKEFEKNVWIDNHYEYNPLNRYKKFYIVFKNGEIKRYGVNKIVGTNVVNNANFILFSQKSGNFKLENVKFHHGTNFINKYDPLFFYFDKKKKKYIHLKYSQIYGEDDIENIYSYSYNEKDNTLYIREDNKIIKEIKDINYYEFFNENPIWLLYSKKLLNDKDFTYYEYNFLIDEEIVLGNSKDERFYTDRYKIYDYLKRLDKSNILYNNSHVYFYISESESIGFKILYSYAKECDIIEKIDNEFFDDTTINYKITCNVNNKKELQFIYWIIKSKDINGISIYNYPIREILKVLDFNIQITKKYNEKTIEDYYDKQKIIEKLKKKFSVDSDEDIVFKLANKYGKEQLLPIEHIDQNSQEYHDLFWEEADIEKYEEIYSKLINDGVIINRWKKERKLFKLVKTYFKDAIYQYHSNFLGKQSLDIFIPSLNIGIEYQGKQHYEPVDFFGGEKSYKEQVDRDSRKREICKKQNIKLIEWEYYENITKETLRNKLKEIGVVNFKNFENKIGIES